MSRGLDFDRDDERFREHEERFVRDARDAHRLLREDDERDPDQRSDTVPSHGFTLPDGRERETVYARSRRVDLRDTESETLVAVGSFRVVFEHDLRDGPYRGDEERLAQDVRALHAQGLLDRRTIAADDEGRAVAVLALTTQGRALLDACRSPDEDRASRQAIHAGWHKPAEIVHDASLYRVYQVEAAAIEARGGRINRVVLDDELKRAVYASLNGRRFESEEARQVAIEDVAHAYHVPIVDGHLEFPDVRIEYSTDTGERGRVDLELVTRAYHGGHLASKQAAGFTLYGARGHAGRGIHGLSSCGRGGAPRHDRHISSLLSL